MNETRTCATPWTLYENISNAVELQRQRLTESSNTSNKIVDEDAWKIEVSKCREINSALEILKRVLTYKSTINKKNSTDINLSRCKCHHSIAYQGTEIKISNIALKNLTTINAMLDFRILKKNYYENKGRYTLTLRQALNISRNNIFNHVLWGWGPLWGKTKTLEEVEKALGI